MHHPARSTAALKGLAVTPGLLVATVLTCMAGALAPPLAGLVLFVGGLAVMVALCAGRLEGPAVRLLYAARRPRPSEAAALAPALSLLCARGLGPPTVTVYVRDGQHAVAAGGVGRRSVLVTSGLVEALGRGRLPADQAAALVCHAVGRVRVGLTRSDPAIEFWSIPWQLLRAVCLTVARGVSVIPLAAFAWRIRFVVTTVAVVQSVVEGRAASGAVIGVFIALTYLAPRWQRAWVRRQLDAGDRFAIDHGFGPPLAAFLRRRPPTQVTVERIHRLAGPPTRPTLSLVTPRGAR